MKKIVILTLPLLLALGCANNRHYVVAATSTIIGVEIAQDAASGTPHAKLGYNRSELAIVPSNRASGKNGDRTTGNGAADTTDVVMELNYGSIFSMSQASIYQRLAVGKNAVSQPGAMIMFAKGKDGALDPQVAESMSRAISTVPLATPSVTALKVPLATAYQQATDKAKFNAAAVAAGFKDFDSFLIDTQVTAAQIEAVKKGLQ